MGGLVCRANNLQPVDPLPQLHIDNFVDSSTHVLDGHYGGYVDCKNKMGLVRVPV